MKDIILLFFDWCFDFYYKPNENGEELICDQLNIKIIKNYDEFSLYHNGIKIDIKNNTAVVRNICKKIESVFSDYASNL